MSATPTPEESDGKLSIIPRTTASILDSDVSTSWWCTHCGGDLSEHPTVSTPQGERRRCRPMSFHAQGFLGFTVDGDRLYLAIDMTPKVQLVESELGAEPYYAWTEVVITGRSIRKNSHRGRYDREGQIIEMVSALSTLAPGWTCGQVMRISELWEKSFRWKQLGESDERKSAPGAYLAELRWHGDRLDGQTGLRRIRATRDIPELGVLKGQLGGYIESECNVDAPAQGSIKILEDNAGSVYLKDSYQTWALGPVTRDMEGRAVTHAEAWRHGSWEPNEDDGQTIANSTEDLLLIATWNQKYGLLIARNEFGDPVAGGGGRRYLGLTSWM